MKFLLIRNADETVQTNKSFLYSSLNSIYLPLGLMYVGASLENNGHKVEIIDLYFEELSREKLKKYLASSDVVGISFTSINYKKAAAISKMIKELDPDIPIIIGGPHCNFVQKNSLHDIPEAEIAVIGEGEEVILDIVKFFEGEKELKDINGIYYRENDEIKTGKHIKIIENLDEIIFPARYLVDKYNYSELSKVYKFKEKQTCMITSRGCPYNCSFCARYNRVIKGWGCRMRSAENVVKEITEIDGKYGTIMIVDDNFLVDVKRAHKIFDMLIDIGIKSKILILGARIDAYDRELYKKMKKSNVRSIEYGVESGNQDVLDFYKKNITIEQIKKTISLAREMDFFISCNFIFGAPIETKKHLNRTIKFACSLPIDVAFFSPLYYQMGSEIWIRAEKENKISKDEFSVMADSRRNLGNFTSEELKYYINKANLIFYYRPKYFISQIYRAYMKK